MGFPHGRTSGEKKKGGHEVTVYNRTGAKRLRNGRTSSAARPPPTAERAAAEGQDFVMCCVGNDNDLRAGHDRH